MRSPHTFLFAAIAALSGCSSAPLSKSVETKNETTRSNEGADQDDLPDMSDEGAVAKKTTTAGKSRKAAPVLRSEELKPLDFSPDGFPRLRKYYSAENQSGESVLERVEYDFNGDGRIDFIQWYDPSGTWVEKDAVDLNGDGVMDVISNYKKGLNQDQPELVLQKFTTPRSKETNIWKYYRNGELRMRAIDRNLDGKPDYWEYYDHGRLVRTDTDSKGDGTPDNQAQFPQVVQPKGSRPPQAR